MDKTQKVMEHDQICLEFLIMSAEEQRVQNHNHVAIWNSQQGSGVSPWIDESCNFFFLLYFRETDIVQFMMCCTKNLILCSEFGS